MAPSEEDAPEHWRKIDALLQELRQLTVSSIAPIGAKLPSTVKPGHSRPSPSAVDHPKPPPASLASSLLATSIFSRLPASGDKAAQELLQLQIALEKRSKK